MCVMSMVMDHYIQKWPDLTQASPTFTWPPQVTKQEFDKLRADVDEMMVLLGKAKEYDARTGQKDCEMKEKEALIRKMAEMVGVDLSGLLSRPTP